MSVDFSWHLEEDVPPVPKGKPRPERQPHWTWLRRVLVIAFVLFVAAGALGYGYYYRQQQRLIAEFQHVLDREVTFWKEGQYDSTRLQFVLDTERWNTRKESYAFLGFFGVTLFPMPSALPPLTVRKVELHGDMAWVWIEWEDEGTRYMRVHFYRYVDGLWKRTIPDKQFWGKQETIEGTLFQWTFYERDAPYVRPLADWAEEAGQSVASDFGLSDPPRLHVRFVYEADKTLSTNPIRSDEIALPALLISRVRVDRKLDRMHQAMVAWAYVNHALEGVAPSMSSSPGSPYPRKYYMFRSAVLQWETARIAMPLWKEIPAYYSLDVRHPPSLENLFGFPSGPPSGDPLIYTVSLAFFISERYGPTKVIALLKQLENTLSVQRALAGVLGPDFDPKTFEQEWHAYLRARADWFQPTGDTTHTRYPTESKEQ